jgi:hypothetical protein
MKVSARSAVEACEISGQVQEGREGTTRHIADHAQLEVVGGWSESWIACSYLRRSAESSMLEGLRPL